MNKDSDLKQLTSERDALATSLEAIHNHLYANDGLSPEQALEETVKLLFLKFTDESDGSISFKISLPELTQINDGVDDGKFIRTFKRFAKSTFERFPDLFEKGDNLKIKTTSLAFSVATLQDLKIAELPYDVKGLAFQKFVSASQRVGRGQFFTPEPVMELCVKILDPQAGEVVLDPACGSGGFLSTAHILSSAKSRGCIPVGIEITKTAARLARMRLILLGIDSPIILQHDALQPIDKLEEELTKINGGSFKVSSDGFADVIVTNPPFGTQGKVADKSILRNFVLGHKAESNESLSGATILQQQIPEVLFVEQCIKLLKPGGRLAIVLPNGEFENSSLRYVRNYLFEQTYIDAIVKLPSETFIPSGTGIKTSVLFCTKKGPTSRRTNRAVFFGEVRKLGFVANKTGAAIYKRDEKGRFVLDEDGSAVIDEDFSTLVAEFGSRKSKSKSAVRGQSFDVGYNELTTKRFDYEYYHPRYELLLAKLRIANAIPLSSLVQMNKERAPILDNSETEVDYIELSDISVEYSEIMHSERMKVFELPSRATFQIQNGDLLVSVAGNSIGTAKHACAMVSSQYDGSICSNGFRVFRRFLEEIDPYYLLYFFTTPEFHDQVYRLRTGAAIPAISDEDLMSVLVPRFDREIEEEIAELFRSGFKSRESFKLKLTRKRNSGLI